MGNRNGTPDLSGGSGDDGRGSLLARFIAYCRRRAHHIGLWMLVGLPIVGVLLSATVFSEGMRLFLLKLTVAAVFAFVPGWLYLQFIENKGISLYDEYVLNLFRLQIDEYRNLPAPPEHTSYFEIWQRHHSTLQTKSKDNLYRRKFEAVYGKSAVSTFEKIHGRAQPRLREKTETFFPVVLTTFLLCLGWVLVLQPEPQARLGWVGSTTFPYLPYETLKFGFFGSYFFILQDLLRRYFRDDLKTGAYISASARVVFVTVILTAVELAWERDDANIVGYAFFVGMFPQLGLQALRLAVALPLRAFIPSLKTDHPLSDIDGLNFWYEARLAEEGIDDIQNLTSANLVDLMLRTRVPISRLVDWVDQGFLHLHLPPGKRKDNAWGHMRAAGIRSATGLEAAWEKHHQDPGFRAVVARALREKDEAFAAARVGAIVSALAAEVNLWHVREFKRHEWLKEGKASSGNGQVDKVTPLVIPEGEPQR